MEIGYVSGCVVKGRRSVRMCCTQNPAEPPFGVSRRELLAGTLGGLALQGLGCADALVETSPWERGDVPTKSEIRDVSLAQSASTAYAVCESGEVLRSTDGGRIFDLEMTMDAPLRTVRFKGMEGWITGRKNVLLYTPDGGENWQRIILPEPLAGDLVLATPTGKKSADIATSMGVILQTGDAGASWKELSEEVPTTVGKEFTGRLRIIRRDGQGNYLGLPLLGRTFFGLKVGQSKWTHFDEQTISTPLSIGFVTGKASDGVWICDRSGNFVVSGDKADLGKPLKFSKNAGLDASGYGILDVAYRDQKNAFAVVGGKVGTIYSTSDAGKTWSPDPLLRISSSSLRRLHYPFAFGQNGLILRHF